MPSIGEITKQKGNYCQWLACLDCGRERWVRIPKGTPESRRCRICAIKRVVPRARGSNHPRWKGGKKYSNGYILVRLEPTDFFFAMANQQGYIMEHRLVMAKHLNRCLLPWEIVHHRNGVRDDNGPENLRLIKGQADHQSFNFLQRQNNQLKQRIEQLEQRVILLEAQLIASEVKEVLL